MREIKFRAWEIEDKKYYPVIKLWFDPQVGKPDSAELWLSRYANEIADIPEQIELEQYTGLKDKNGKEIYEGDIVEVCAMKMNGQILYDDVYCAYRIVGIGEEALNINLGDFDWRMLEILGNIHENPELIGKEQ